MKNGNGNGNATGVSFTTAVIEDNPYLQRFEDEHQQTRASAENEVFDLADEDEQSSALDHTTVRRKKTQRRRKLVLAGVALLLLVSAVCVFALQYRSSTRVEYGQTAKQSRVVPPAPNATTTTGRDTRTEQAIEEAQRLTTDTRPETSPGPATNTPLVATEATRNSGSNPATPFTVPPDIGGTVKTKSDALDSRPNTDSISFNEKAPTSSAGTASANDARTVPSQPSSETSLYSNERANRSTLGSTVRPNSRTFSAREAKATVVLPSFGSMLPVRTIGGLYTLRSGALTRLELTRDMNGNGWSLKRGTILVGTSKGGEYDRAYVSIVGFIDPQSGKLVKLGGDVLGGDGGAGLKGKRRQLDGGWARMLGKVGTAALNVTGALVGGRGNGTVIISDGLRTRAVNPITDEISGVIGGELNQKQRRGFVEVVAGTTGYVMVTDLPSIIKGTEASPDLNEETLAAITDVDAARPATGLSERELAELLATGSPEEIRAAMPRMSPELRKIAAAVLEQ
jgi:cytoskeletal protein RodZ